MKSIGIIGFGVMGEAFAAGLKARMPSVSLIAHDVRRERVEAASRTHGVKPAASPAEVLQTADISVLCVKPQDFEALAGDVKSAAKGRSVISIIAGRRIQAISGALGTEQVVRFMPNVAATRGSSQVGVSFHPAAAPSLRADALAIAAALGSSLEIPEKLMSAMTGVSGSGIAFVFSFVNAMALGGVASGFDYKTALSVATATLESAVSLLKDGTHPLELASRVISPAGTTIQGVRALERGGLTAAVMEAVEAAARKAAEMEG
jgi:pyrroline-5-carboxylate reductase